jgi:hypothetical protein
MLNVKTKIINKISGKNNILDRKLYIQYNIYKYYMVKHSNINKKSVKRRIRRKQLSKKYKKSKESTKKKSRSRSSIHESPVRSSRPIDEFYFSIPDDYSYRQIKNMDIDIEKIMLLCDINKGNRVSLEEGLKTYSCGIFDEESIDLYKNICISIYIQDNTHTDIKGICFIKIFMKRELSIDLLCVPPKHKGKGTVLINKIKKIADFINCKIVLSAIPGGVVKFYKKTGFVIKNDGDGDDEFLDDYENEDYALNVQMEYIPPHFIS